MRILGTFIIGILLTSCATLSRKTYNLSISSSTNGDKIEVNNEVYTLPAEVNVKRSRTDLQIKLISGTTVTDYKVKSALRPAFIYGDLLFFPVTHLVDLTNQKRFYYGKSVSLDKNDSQRVISPGGQKRAAYWVKKYP